MVNRPVPSVTADRVFSISTLLDASTFTPGSTAPDVSFATPVNDAWAYAAAGNKARHRTSITLLASARFIRGLLRVIRTGSDEAGVYAGDGVSAIQKRPFDRP
jgi:hypothetical protein